MERQRVPTSARLPGIGERLDVLDADGRPFSVIRRRSGHVELHHQGAVVDLQPTPAATVGAFMSGHFRMSPEVADRVSDVLGGLTFDWVQLTADDAAVGHSIEELEVRRRTGVTIVAILRGSVPIVAPEPSARFEAGDDLVVACRENDLDRFVRYVTEGSR